MTREEMINIANRMREKGRRPVQGVDDFLQVTICEEEYITTELGISHIYVIKPVENKDVKTGDMKTLNTNADSKSGEADNDNLPWFFNLHGGGFTKTHGERDIAFCREMVYLTGCIGISMDYRLAPEYQYPVALDEEEAVLRYLVRHSDSYGLDPNDCILIGQSSGGNHAAVLSMRLKNDPEIVIKGQICCYLPTDLMTDASEKSLDGDIKKIEMSRLFNDFYIPDSIGRDEPEISPLYARKDMLEGVPKTILISAGKDELCEECKKYADHLADANVDVELRNFPDSKHGFVINQNGDWRKSRVYIAYKIMELLSA